MTSLRYAILMAMMLGCVFVQSVYGYSILLDIDTDDDPTTLNEHTGSSTAVVRLVLHPTEPNEWIADIFFGLGGTCWPCDYIMPGWATYGTDWNLTWSGPLPEFPQLSGSGPICSLAIDCQGNPGFHCYWEAISQGGFVLDQPVFIGTFTAWVHDVYHPGCPLPPSDLMAFTEFGGPPGNTILLADPLLALNDARRPGKSELLPCYPNPFNPRTTLSFTLPEAGNTTLAIHDARGSEVARLVDESLAAGTHSVDWTGVDAFGRAVPSGTYFCRLSTASGVEVRKMSLLR